MNENFDELFTLLSNALSDKGTNVNNTDYDGILVMQLSDSNLMKQNKKSGNKQTHIAITAKSRYIFPILSNWWQEENVGLENAKTLNKYSEILLPINLYTSNLKYLKDNSDREVELQLNSAKDKVSTYSYVYSRPGDQIQLSKITRDDSKFISFRKLLFQDDYLVFLKVKEKYSYDVFGIKNDDLSLENNARFSTSVRSTTQGNQIKPNLLNDDLKEAFKDTLKELSQSTYNGYIKALKDLEKVFKEHGISDNLFNINFLLSLDNERYENIRRNPELNTVFVRDDGAGGTDASAVFRRIYEFKEDLLKHGFFINQSRKIPKEIDYQRIFSGAPGTGKSYILNKEKENYFPKNNFERVTFHPKYSYGNFVGSYKPFPMDGSGDKITYTFVPGPLMRIIEKAYSNLSENYLIIIEELNRADAAAVFGDTFQLLDRDNSGWSDYPIATTEEIRNYLSNKYKAESLADARKNIENVMGKKYGVLKFPPNLYIWATVNPADQGVKPLDSAFKRRWEYEYIGIDDAVNEEFESYTLSIAGAVNDDGSKREIKWNDLRKEINKKLSTYPTINEDKFIGPYFISKNILNLKNPEKTEQNVANKVLLYLYDDVIKGPQKNNFFKEDFSKNYSLVREGFYLYGEEIIQGIEKIESVNEKNDSEEE